METRSSSKVVNMTVSDEIKEYFTQLLEPLATNESILEMFTKFKEDVLTKVTEQANRIDELEALLSVRKVVVDKLTEKCDYNEKLLATLEIKCDNNEQYSRRTCLRIHGIEFDDRKAKDEKVNDLVKICYETMGLKFDENVIDRAHRIGSKYTDKVTGKQTKSIIVKFKSWAPRSEFYKKRPRNFENGKKKPGAAPFSVSLDLTKRKYELLKRAEGIINQYQDIKYAFCDINCSLGLKLTNDKFVFFNDDKQLKDLLIDLRRN